MCTILAKNHCRYLYVKIQNLTNYYNGFFLQVLPLENKMKTPGAAPRVITLTMVGIILLYVVFGVLGYIVYGECIKGSITLNLISKNDIEIM